jgi:hypothetical protein
MFTQRVSLKLNFVNVLLTSGVIILVGLSFLSFPAFSNVWYVRVFGQVPSVEQGLDVRITSLIPYHRNSHNSDTDNNININIKSVYKGVGQLNSPTLSTFSHKPKNMLIITLIVMRLFVIENLEAYLASSIVEFSTLSNLHEILVSIQ